MTYNKNFAKLGADGLPVWAPVPLVVVTHHHEEWDEPVIDPETGEPTGETEHMVRDWDTYETKVRPTVADFLAAGYYPYVDILPSAPASEGMHWEPSGYEFSDGAVRRTYAEVADPPRPPRRWSSLAIKRTLEGAGRWTEVKAMLETADVYDDFMMADYIAEDDQAFMDAKAAAAEMYGEEAVDALLDRRPQT